MVKILHIDDEHGVCNSFKRNLERTGLFQVESTNNGGDFLQMLDNPIQRNGDLFVPDIFLVDIDLKDANDAHQNGEVLIGSIIRTQPQYQKFENTPVVFLTNWPDEKVMVDKSKASQGYWYCSKDPKVGTQGLLDLLLSISQILGD